MAWLAILQVRIDCKRCSVDGQEWTTGPRFMFGKRFKTYSFDCA
jgi:hypothetical protein